MGVPLVFPSLLRVARQIQTDMPFVKILVMVLILHVSEDEGEQ